MSSNLDKNGIKPVEGSVLSVADLEVSFAGESGSVRAVRGLSFDLAAGESMAVVGESGAGKSATSLAIMGLLPGTARVNGSIKLLGEELLDKDDAAMSRLRGRSMAMVFQDPLSAMTPVHTVGDQIVEAIRVHHPISHAAALKRSIELLDLVGIPEPKRRAAAFPHEFSGGMRQRAMIAMAIANEPAVIVADEPTTALDVTIQAQILEVLERARQETQAALLLITHDLGVVAAIAEQVTVMYAGRAVEQGSVRSVFHSPRMPYTMGLLASIPRPDNTHKQPLTSIEGSPPSMNELFWACPFAVRCPLATDACRQQEPELLALDGTTHRVACFRSDMITDEQVTPMSLFGAQGEQNLQATNNDAVQDSTAFDDPAVLLELSGMARHFPMLEGALFRRRVGTIHAVDGVDLVLNEGETLGLVGESGCGKSTTVQSIMELKVPTKGSISVLGKDVSQIHNSAERLSLRRQLQVVFQDPMSSLDPRMPVFDLIAEPLGVFGVKGPELTHRVEHLLQLVGLDAGHLSRYPQQLSGGQRQRVGIARALALEPRILILDEPVSALDVSIRASIVNLLDSLKSQLGLSYLFVAHDLAVVRHFADRVAVMYLGVIVEVGDVESLYRGCVHPYTQSLLSAMPIPDPDIERHRKRIVLKGDMPSPANPPSGCRFHTRCPKKPDLDQTEQRRCETEIPKLQSVKSVALPQQREGASQAQVPGKTRVKTQHESACHFNHIIWNASK